MPDSERATTTPVRASDVIRGRGAFYPHLPYAMIVEPGEGELPYCADCQHPLTQVTELVWACPNAEYHGQRLTLWVSNRLANHWNGDGLLHKHHEAVAEHLAAESVAL